MSPYLNDKAAKKAERFVSSENKGKYGESKCKVIKVCRLCSHQMTILRPTMSAAINHEPGSCPSCLRSMRNQWFILKKEVIVTTKSK